VVAKQPNKIPQVGAATIRPFTGLSRYTLVQTCEASKLRVAYYVHIRKKVLNVTTKEKD
jgi:hypothetical protein